MCYVFYAILGGLLFIYGDHLLESFVLAAPTDDGELMAIAVGWEIALLLWPILVMAGLIASATTLLITRRSKPPADR